MTYAAALEAEIGSACKSLLTLRRNGRPRQSRRIAKTISVVSCLGTLNRHREQTVMASIAEPDPAQALTQERDGGRETRDYATVDVVIRLGLIGLLIYWSLRVIGPFVTVALWSAILVVALYPIFDWLSRSLRSPRLAATLITDQAVTEDGWRWHILADPDGNEFCVLQPPGEGQPTA